MNESMNKNGKTTHGNEAIHQQKKPTRGDEWINEREWKNHPW
jgi:hypothetical protein